MRPALAARNPIGKPKRSCGFTSPQDDVVPLRAESSTDLSANRPVGVDLACLPGQRLSTSRLGGRAYRESRRER